MTECITTYIMMNMYFSFWRRKDSTVCMFSYTCKIMFGLTLWQIKQEVYNQVESYITTAVKVEALQSQPRFGKAVLEQKVPTKDWFAFTEVQEGK